MTPHPGRGHTARHVMPRRLTAGAAALAALAALALPATGAAAATGGTLMAWGLNTTGQLGDGSTTTRTSPVNVQLPPGTTITSVRSGCFHTLALTSTGQVLAWGANDDGQLGNGTTTSSSTPVPVSLPVGVTVKAIRAGCVHSLALTTTGQVLAWGFNTDGELGNGANVASDLPVPVSLPVGVTVKAISAGDFFSLALTTAGQVLAWGDNSESQLGNGTTTKSSIPVPVRLPAGITVAGVAAGLGDGLALTTTGQVFGWGSNGAGELATGSIGGNISTPVKAKLPAGTTVRSLFGGGSHVLALTTTGKLLAWGDNDSGQLGTGSFQSGSSAKPVAVKIPTGTTVTAITAGISQSYALTKAGRVLAWGFNTDGELGNGTTSNHAAPVTVKLPAGVTAAGLGSGPAASTGVAIVHGTAAAATRAVAATRLQGTAGPRAAVATSGPTLRAWGSGTDGQLGNGTDANTAAPVKVKVQQGTTVTQVRGGCHFTVALTSKGKVLAWGDNTFGQLGIGSTGGSVSTPVFVHLPAGTTVTAVRAGCRHALALTSTGQVLAWGDNSFGQLGDGTTVDRDTPVFAQLPPGVVVTAISAGWYHSLALASNHTVLFAWGRDQSGQLGIGNFNDSDRPIEVAVSGFTMTGLAAGFADSYAVTSDGRVLAWGDNTFGELGDNLAETANTTPGIVPLPGGAKATAVSGGEFHVLARTSTGHVLAWGLNDHGQLGDRSHTERDVPVAVPLPGGATVRALSTGESHSLALTTTGKVFAWGRGTEGELGNGGFSDHDAPVLVQLATGSIATGIASGPGASHSLAFVRTG